MCILETARIIIIFLLFVVTACAGDDKENIGHSLSHRWNLSSVVELEFVGDDFGDDEEFVFGPVELLALGDAQMHSHTLQNSSLSNGHFYLLYAGDEALGKVDSHLLLDNRIHPLTYRVDADIFSSDTIYIELHYSYEQQSDTMLEYLEGVLRLPFKVVPYATGFSLDKQKMYHTPFIEETLDTLGKKSLLLDLNLLLM